MVHQAVCRSSNKDPTGRCSQSRFAAWSHDPQHRMTINALEREIDQMRLRIDGYRMRMRHEKHAFRNERLSILAKDGYLSGFRRHVQPLVALIEREDIRTFSNRVSRQDIHICKIHHGDL